MKACQPDHNGKKTKRFKTFQVRWEIDIDAVSHRAAAKVAQDIPAGPGVVVVGDDVWGTGGLCGA